MSKTSTKDRRRHGRLPTRINVQGTAEPEGAVARMVTRDLSLGGLYCTSNRDFPEMTRLSVRLLLPKPGSGNGEAEPLDLEAVVVRREKAPAGASGDERYHFALYFTNLGSEDRERIRGYLEGMRPE